MPKPSPLLAFLAGPSAAEAFTPWEWSLLFAEARACGLGPRLAAQLRGSPLPSSIPKRFQDHLRDAEFQADALVRDVHREARYLRTALSVVRTPVLLLKGAAYVVAGLPAARGRIFSDIDILVERSQISAAESALMLAGWTGSHHDPYEQRYYREWSHEIPPMTHVRRGTTVDLHHSLVMPTARVRIDSAKMIAAAVPIAGADGWWRLRDEDLVLHAVVHLLLNSEFDRGLRDLGDIDQLFRHFSAKDPGFCNNLFARAGEVGLTQLARRAFVLCHRFYCTPVPDTVISGVGGVVLDLLGYAATTRHPDTRPRAQAPADWLLMLREAALRLPPHLLARHLWHKFWSGLTPPVEKTAA